MLHLDSLQRIKSSRQDRTSFLLRALFLCVVPFVTVEALAQSSRGERIGDRQGQNGYNSITDGQPATPGRPQLDLVSGTDFDRGGFVEAAVEFTPQGSGFLRNMLLVATGPRLNLDTGESGFARRIGVAWQQRWFIESGRWPTFSTEIMASAGPNLHAVVVTLIGAKNAGPGVLYANAFFQPATTEDAFAGAALGYKRPLGPNLQTIGAIVIGDDVLQFELSLEYARAALTIGPGLAFTRPSDEIVAGVFLTYTL